MPTGASPRRRETQSHLALNGDLTEEERVAVAQLQQAIQEATASDDHEPPSGHVTDGARKPVAAGADYTSLRLITRRAPKDADAVVAGLDTSNADLSWTAADPGFDPNGRPWLYPKTRGKGRGSNLEQFRDEIEERTKDGQGCQAIADILVAKGVDTSSRAVARQRMKWGLRQRAPRRMTAQGLANIRKAHLEQAKRLANSDPVPVKRVRIRVMRKAEITRMTREGMSSAQIAENLTSRGVKLKRGAATVERLRTIWGLSDDANRNVVNVRAMAKNQAQRLQKEQFRDIARELGIQDVTTWVKNKMAEEVAEEAKREYAYMLMGDAKPKPLSTRQRAGISQYQDQKRQKGNSMTKMSGVDFVPQNGPDLSPSPGAGQQGISSSTSAEASPAVAAGTGAPPEVMDISDDDEDDDNNDTEDDEAEVAAEEAAAEEAAEAQERASAKAQQQPPATMDVESLGPSFQPPPAFDNSSVQQDVVPQQVPPPPFQANNSPSGPSVASNIVFFKTYGCGRGDGQQLVNASVTTAPPAGMPGRPNSFVNVAPRSLAPRAIAPRAIAPRPTAPLTPPSHALKVEADYMAQFGLFPYPTQGKPPQKYLTPTGLITTDGYEYLAAPPLPSTAASPPPPPQSQPVPGQLGPDYIVVPALPPSKISRVPAPPLVMPPEEVEKHRSDHKALQEYQKVTQECMSLLAARLNGRPILNSLTGLPPSLRDIQKAKEKIKEAATALLAEL